MSRGCVAHAYPVCHRAERSDVAISIPKQRSLPQRDCRASLAMTTRTKLGTCEQQRYLDFLAAAERYHVFGDRLVILTRIGDGLVFQAVAGKP